MNADELYEQSKGGWPYPHLSKRTRNALSRARYGLNEPPWYPLDRERIKADVLSGEIWGARQIGEVAMKEICEWLAATEGDE